MPWKKVQFYTKLEGWCVVQLSREGNELQVLRTPEQTLSAWQQKQITDKSVPILFSLFFSAKMRETTEISQKVKAVEPPGTWAGSGLPSIQCNSRCCPLISKPLFCVRSSNLSDVSLRLEVSAWDQAGLLANGPQVWVSSGWGFQETGDWGWGRGLWQAAQIYGMCLLCLPGGQAFGIRFHRLWMLEDNRLEDNRHVTPGLIRFVKALEAQFLPGPCCLRLGWAS